MSSMSSDARTIITKNTFLTLATVSEEGNPWITPLYFVFERESFYWYSRKDAEHSLNIVHNPTVSAVIYNTQATSESVGAVYASGGAYELSGADLKEAISTYFMKASRDDTTLTQDIFSRVEDFAGDSPVRMYRFTPEKVWLLGESKKWRQKWLDYRKVSE
jgi:nitroimidazol reductase NimA-like FMN-containing flavoprotein (pyridoxamine 5'-phosphate oxidase superfamily)